MKIEIEPQDKNLTMPAFRMPCHSKYETLRHACDPSTEEAVAGGCEDSPRYTAKTLTQNQKAKELTSQCSFLYTEVRGLQRATILKYGFLYPTMWLRVQTHN